MNYQTEKGGHQYVQNDYILVTVQWSSVLSFFLWFIDRREGILMFRALSTVFVSGTRIWQAESTFTRTVGIRKNCIGHPK